MDIQLLGNGKKVKKKDLSVVTFKIRDALARLITASISG
jgi:hypothetical protein